jgi:hypothetical protein
MFDIRKALARASLIVFLFAAPLFADAATLFISPEADSYSAGKTFSVRIRVSSPQSINAVSGNLVFPTDKLQVTSVSKAGSILTLWVQDPSYSNAAGTVSFEGVVPNPGYSGTGGLVATVTFRVVGAGNATVNFTNASVLANDGSGTNVLQSVVPANYSLGGVAPAAEPVVAPTQSAGTPRAPTVSSTSHPSPSQWYKEKNAKFAWTLESDTTATKVLLGKSPNSTPTVEYDPPISSKEVENIEDGIWYLHVQNKNAKGWGGITHFMIKVDSVDPESFTMKEISRSDATDPRVKLSLQASDNFSGIKSFGIQIDKGEMEEWVDDGTGIYTTDPLTPGEHNIFARAYDQAGNFATASVNVKVIGIAQPKVTSYTDKVSGSSPLVVKGTSLPNATVRVTLRKGGGFGFFTASAQETTKTQDGKTDESGNFSVAVDTSELESGSYEMTATAVDRRGAQSEPTVAKTVLINTGFLRSVLSGAMTTLAVAVPILALMFVLYIVFLRGVHHVRRTRSSMRTDIHNTEQIIDKAFDLLREDVEDSIRLLERTKSRRRLTAEEEAIIERLRTNLHEAEKVIHNEMRKVEKRLD